MLDAAKMVFLKALRQIVPLAQPFRSGIHPPLWFADFYYEGNLTEALIPLVEEGMRSVAKSNAQFKQQEMLLSNAVEFWKHHGYEKKVESLEGKADGVRLFLLLGDILEEAEEEPTSTLEAGEIQILSLQEVEPQVYRVWGSSFETKEEAKSYKKRFTEWERKKRNLPIISAEGPLWKKGESAQMLQMMKILFNACAEEKIAYLFTPPGDKFTTHLELFKQSGAKVWRSFEVVQEEEIQDICCLDDPFSTDFPLRDVQFRFFPEEKMEEELISSLHFIEKITTMFGISVEVHLRYHLEVFKSKKRFEWLLDGVYRALENRKAIETKTSDSGFWIEYQLVDALDRRWPGSRIELLDKPIVFKSKGGKRQVECLKSSVFLSLERWMSIVEDKSTN